MNMDKTLFEELVGSLKEAKAIAKGACQAVPAFRGDGPGR